MDKFAGDAVMVLNDGETYTSISGCMIVQQVEMPDNVEDVEEYAEKLAEETGVAHWCDPESNDFVGVVVSRFS